MYDLWSLLYGYVLLSPRIILKHKNHSLSQVREASHQITESIHQSTASTTLQQHPLKTKRQSSTFDNMRAPQCHVALVRFPFLDPQNNVIPVPIASSCGMLFTMDQFLNNAFSRAARVIQAASPSNRERYAQSEERLKSLLEANTTIEVQWNLGGNTSGCTKLSRHDAALWADAASSAAAAMWADAAMMLGSSGGLHYVVLDKEPEAVEIFRASVDEITTPLEPPVVKEHIWSIHRAARAPRGPLVPSS